jgi:glucose/arabinose dehydrogenase
VRLLVWTLVAVALAAVARMAVRAAPPPPTAALPPPDVAAAVKLTVVASGLAKPVALTFAPGDPRRRLFVVEKEGRIRILAGGRLVPASFLDIAARVSGSSEQGLLGLAFHPDFARNGRFFINFTDREGDTRVVERRVRADDPDRADPAFERELLFVEQPYENHNGGDLVFGPDGQLYVGLGDGGSANDPHGNGQNDRVLLAKMLRLDVDAEPRSGPAKVAVVAKGLRNPWRYAFDRATGDLWIADVGQNDWEEIDVVPFARLVPVPPGEAAPLNFGWNVVEGRHCFKAQSCDQHGLVAPIAEYDHDEGCSITGGFVYRGKALPALIGRYVFADYCTAMIRSLRWTGERVEDLWDWRPALDPGSQLARLSSFGEDGDGELYLLSLEGTVYRFDPAR